MIILPRRIVLCGVSRAGKSTLAAQLEKEFAYQPTAFADPAKRAAREVFGFEDEHLYGASVLRETPYRDFEFSGWCFECGIQCHGPERHLSPQTLDTDTLDKLRNQYAEAPDYFLCPQCQAPFPRYVTVREALRTLATAWGRKFCHNLWALSCFASMEPQHHYVVSDLRFRNEREAAKQHRACTVLLLRALDGSTSPHPSEAELREMARDPSGFDIVLDNRTGTIEENFTTLLVEFIVNSDRLSSTIDMVAFPSWSQIAE